MGVQSPLIANSTFDCCFDNKFLFLYFQNCKTHFICNTHLLTFVMRNKTGENKNTKNKKYGNNFTNILFCLANWFLFSISIVFIVCFFIYFFYFAQNGLTNCFKNSFWKQKTILFQTSGKFLSNKFPLFRRK